MSSTRRRWQEPVVKSIDQCQPIFGECKVGSSPTSGGAFQCSSGTGATVDGICRAGNGAKSACTKGNGVK